MPSFATADLHLGHANIIGFCDRPFVDLHQMTSAMVREWNAVVTPKDTVWVLGDFHFKDPEGVLQHLNGHLHLVKGNHDSKKTIRHTRWESVSDLKSVSYGGNRFELCHYPLEAWRKSHWGRIHLHGHSHGKSRIVPYRFDVGWDVYGKPIPLEYFAAKALALL